MPEFFYNEVFWVALCGFGLYAPVVRFAGKTFPKRFGFAIQVLLNLALQGTIAMVLLVAPLRIWGRVPLSGDDREHYQLGLLAGLLISIAMLALMKKREQASPFS